MTEYIADPAGSIYSRVTADRATVTAVADTHLKTATEMRDWLYELVATAYLRRDPDLMMKSMAQLCDFMGWCDGGGKTAVDAEAAP